MNLIAEYSVYISSNFGRERTAWCAPILEFEN
jgi:hypothetical protein